MGDAAGDGGEAPGTSTPPASPSSSCTSQGQTRRAPSRGSRAGLELWVRQPGGVSVEPQAPSPTLLHPPPLRSPTAASHRPQTAPSARGPLVHASPATSPSSCGWPHPQRSTPHPLCRPAPCPGSRLPAPALGSLPLTGVAGQAELRGTGETGTCSLLHLPHGCWRWRPLPCNVLVATAPCPSPHDSHPAHL